MDHLVDPVVVDVVDPIRLSDLNLVMVLHLRVLLLTPATSILIALIPHTILMDILMVHQAQAHTITTFHTALITHTDTTRQAPVVQACATNIPGTVSTAVSEGHQHG